MSGLSKALLAALLLVAAPARAQLGRGSVGSHDHSTANKGGTTLAPATLSVTGNTTLATVTASSETVTTLNVPMAWQPVSSGTATGGTFEWTGLSSSTGSWRIEYECTTSLAATSFWGFTISSDTGANYAGSITGKDNTSAAHDNNNSNYIPMSDLTSGVLAGGFIVGEVTFGCTSGRCLVRGTNEHVTAATRYVTAVYGGYWSGTSFSAVSIRGNISSAAAISTCRYTLFRRRP